ncbi:MAG: LysM peptidoglycan-binding domain-containing protein [Rudaea sp.]
MKRVDTSNRSARRVCRQPRDWRMAVLGAGCTTLGAACLLLAACSTAPRKPLIAAQLPAPATAPARVEPRSTSSTAPAPAVALSPWAQLRGHFVLPDCDYNPDVTHLAHWFSADPSGFAESLRQALPFLLFVARRVEARGMPGEFALLPYIESNYVPLGSTGDRAAGIWQLLPDTAREAGLRIGTGYDGRLDIAASTEAALDLLERYYDHFGDWRVVDMAFNAGPYRIAKLLGNSAVPASAAGLGRLRVDAHTHRHLAKLLAVACVVSDPSRFDVTLPEPGPADFLTLVPLPAPLDLQLAARLAGVDAARLRQLNPGYLRGRMPSASPFHLLLPEAQSRTLTAALDKLPQPLWREWHEIVLRESETLDVLAQAHGVDTNALATANSLAADATLAPGTRVLMPGRGTGFIAEATTSRTAENADTHIVHAGDTLWRIARAAHVNQSDLLRWNDLTRTSVLRPGQRLRLQAPDRGGVAATAAANPD